MSPPSQLTVKCRVHLGDSTSGRLQGSIPTVIENAREGQGRQPSPCPPCRIWCHCYADDFVTGRSRPMWELFHQHISCLFSGSSSSYLLTSSLEETYLSTASPRQSKMPASQPQTPACAWKGLESQVRDLVGYREKCMPRTMALAFIFPLYFSIYGYAILC